MEEGGRRIEDEGLRMKDGGDDLDMNPQLSTLNPQL